MYIYIYIYTCMYVCMYIYIYIYIHIVSKGGLARAGEPLADLAEAPLGVLELPRYNIILCNNTIYYTITYNITL